VSHLAPTRVGNPGLGHDIGIAMSVVSSGVFDVLIGDTTYSVRAMRGLTVAVGDPILIARQGSARWALGRLFTAAPTAPANDPAPPSKPTSVIGSLICGPVSTQSYRDGAWRTDRSEVVQGRWVSSGFGNNTGCAFYGSKPRSITGATVTRARIRVRRLAGGAFGATTATLRLVTQATRPAGAPTLNESTTGPRLAIKATDNSFDIPASWAQAMVDGTRGGLAVHVADGSPYMVFAGKAQWSAAWTLTISWRRP